MVDKQLLDQKYYHGLLPREDIKAMLKKDGDFIVRTSEPTAGQPRAFVLSVMLQQELEEQGLKHYVIQQIGGKYSIERWSFDSIPDMITHHLKKGESVSKANDKAILKTGIPRQDWELTHDEIQVTKKLGEGAFGEVSLGKFTLKKTNKVIDVAIKLAKLETLTKEQVREIMHEARLMRMFKHPNVIKIHGVAALQEPLMLVMELASDGALDSYLKKHTVTVTQKCDMCSGASFGIEYLHNTCNVIHRDIAARNCLFGDGQVKISDFGLTVEGSVYQMDPSKRVPIRWLAPETLRTALYSPKSDVFAYGILCWEIFSNGVDPYPGMTVAEVNCKVKEGYRMQFPAETPPEVSNMVINKCWTGTPNDRFSMTEVSKFWERNFGARSASRCKSSSGVAKQKTENDDKTRTKKDKDKNKSKEKKDKSKEKGRKKRTKEVIG